MGSGCRRAVAGVMVAALLASGCSVHTGWRRELRGTEEEESRVVGSRVVLSLKGGTGGKAVLHADRVEDVESRCVEIYERVELRRKITGLVLGIGIPVTVFIVLFIALLIASAGSDSDGGGGGGNWDWDD